MQTIMDTTKRLLIMLNWRRSDWFRSERSFEWCTSSGSTRSEEHTSELQSLMRSSYAVFCLKKKKQKTQYSKKDVKIHKNTTHSNDYFIRNKPRDYHKTT